MSDESWKNEVGEKIRDREANRDAIWEAVAGEALNGQWVEMMRGQIDGHPTLTPVLSVEGKRTRLPSHNVLIDKLWEADPSVGDSLYVQCLGKAAGKRYFLYTVVNTTKKEKEAKK